MLTGLSVGLCGLLLSACSGESSGALGHEACVEVAASIKTYDASLAHPRTEKGAAEQAEAMTDLRTALRQAALAASGDGQWQALKATLSESSRVPEANLVSALSAQCAETLSS